MEDGYLCREVGYPPVELLLTPWVGLGGMEPERYGGGEEGPVVGDRRRKVRPGKLRKPGVRLLGGGRHPEDLRGRPFVWPPPSLGPPLRGPRGLHSFILHKLWFYIPSSPLQAPNPGR